ncbi:MAG: hypothetical protein AAB492_02880 [Patescibacteria group bacterium]
MEKIFAQSLSIGSYTIEGPADFAFGDAKIGTIVQAALPYVFAFAGLGVLLMVVAAGFTMLTSAGDAKKLESGKGRLTNAIIGFFLIFAAYWIVQLAGYIFGWSSIGGSGGSFQ